MQFAMETQEFPNSDSVGFQSLGPGVVSFACIHFSDTPNISYVVGYVIRCVCVYKYMYIYMHIMTMSTYISPYSIIAIYTSG